MPKGIMIICLIVGFAGGAVFMTVLNKTTATNTTTVMQAVKEPEQPIIRSAAYYEANIEVAKEKLSRCQAGENFPAQDCDNAALAVERWTREQAKQERVRQALQK